VTGKGVDSILTGCSRLKWFDVSQCRNLESWLRAGGVKRWGYNDRQGEPPAHDSSWTSDDKRDDMPPPKTMSVSMLTTPHYLPRQGSGLMGRTKPRVPVRFLTEKGFQGLR
jgi:F-box/leucine-rich repeat protein 7